MKVYAGDFPSGQLAQQGFAAETVHNWLHQCYLVVTATAWGLLDPDELCRGDERCDGDDGGGDYAAGAGHDSDCSPSYIPSLNKGGLVGEILYYQDSVLPRFKSFLPTRCCGVDAAARSADADAACKCNICMIYICICIRLCV